MGKNQGFYRITNGFTKIITQTEISRGYLFVTHDKRALKLLGPKVTIMWEGKIIKKNIDRYGRIFVGKIMLNSLPKEINVEYKDGKLQITNVLP